MTFEEFRKQTLKVNQSRKHKVTNSIGVYDIYKYIRKNKWEGIGQKITEKQFYAIIRTLNKALIDQLFQNKDVRLPYLGQLELRKKETKVKFIDNRLIVTKPIDWDQTLKLWYEDQEAKEQKILIRGEQKEVYKIHYNKSRAKYKNKAFFEFQPNRQIKVKLKEYIINNKIDAFKRYE